jgi:DNA-binding CsgD family transcriptional regulator
MTGGEARPARLIGRNEELGLVYAALGDIFERGQTLSFVGDPGVGKSALLEAAGEDARRRGLTVLSVRGNEAETHLRFAALHQLLRPILNRVEGLPPGHRAALLSAFGIAPTDPAPDRFFIALAVLELIADAGAETPIVLIVDDLHWVDGASRDAIEFVARRVAAEPAVILLATRPTGRGIWSVEQGLTSFRLGALDPAASRALLQEHSPRLPAADVRRVLAAAAGNPLALIELPLALGSATATTRQPGAASVRLTARLERSFAVRAHDLDSATRTLLLVAALQDSDRLAETLAATAALTGGQPEGVSVGVDAATTAGLLSIDGASFRFHHPLVRSAIAQSATPDQLRAVHEAFARTLTVDPDRATWHRALTASQPDEELAGALDAGADRAVARGAPDLAEEWLERAAQLSMDDRRRGHRLLRAAELAFELGRRESVHQLMGEARILMLDPPDYARLAGLEGAFDDGVPGDEDNVRRLVQAADRARGGGEQGLAADLLLGAAMPCYWGAAEEPLRSRVRAGTRVLGLPAADPRVMVLNALIDPFDQGAALVGQLAQWVEQDTPDPALASALGRTGFVVGDFDRGLVFARRACEGLRQQGRVALLAQALVLQTFAALYLGRWDISHVASDEAYRLAVETHQPVWAACAQLGQANVAGLRGEYERARLLSGEVEQTALVAGNRALLNGVQLTRGLAALGYDRPAEAFTELCRMMDRRDQAYHSPQCAWAIDYLAEAAALSGRSDHALAVLQELHELIGATTAPDVTRAMTLSSVILADDSNAGPRFGKARELAAAAPPWYRARLDLVYGSWLRRQRRIAESRGPLRSARATFDALGAAAWSARAQNELAATGQRAERHAPDAWAMLSAQELQIAQLAARGLSNREIGARLYLSHRTVGSHLYRLFPKLGVHSRAQLHSALAND